MFHVGTYSDQRNIIESRERISDSYTLHLGKRPFAPKEFLFPKSMSTILSNLCPLFRLHALVSAGPEIGREWYGEACLRRCTCCVSASIYFRRYFIPLRRFSHEEVWNECRMMKRTEWHTMKTVGRVQNSANKVSFAVIALH